MLGALGFASFPLAGEAIEVDGDGLLFHAILPIIAAIMQAASRSRSMCRSLLG